MATTALVSEIVILGLEAEGWLALLVFGFFGRGWVDLSGVSDWQALATIIVLAAAYMLGIVVDRLADSSTKFLLPDAEDLVRKRLRVLHNSPGVAPHLEYQRSRFRIARGTLFNLPPAAIGAGVYLAKQTDADRGWLAVLVVVAGAMIAVLVFVTRRVGKAYIKNLEKAIGVIEES